MIKDINEWEVLTPSGWSNFSGIKRTTRAEYFHLITDRGELKCSIEHRIKLKDNKFRRACDLCKGDILYNNIQILNINLVKEEIELFDLLDVEKDSEYYTNDILSHNCAHVEGIDELWTGLGPTLSLGGNCIILSSPSGTGTWFHKIHTDAEAGLNNFKPIKLNWQLHPDRDQAWFDNETKSMSKKQIAQEFLCTFNMSGDTVIDGDDIARLEAAIKDPLEKKGFDKNLWIFKAPVPGRRYMLVADTARGDGTDYSTFHIVDIDDVEVVAEYQGKLDIAMFSTLIFNAGLEYNGALVIPENNNLGYMTASKVIEMGYPNMYYERKHSKEQVDALEAEMSDNVVPGFNTGPKNRILLVAKFEEYVRLQVLKTYSIRTINEMKTFIWKENRPEAMRGCHDDLIMPLAIGCWVRDTVLSVSTRENEMKKALLNAMTMTSKSLNTKIPGEIGYRPKEDPWSNLNETKQLYKDFAWVLG